MRSILAILAQRRHSKGPGQGGPARTDRARRVVQEPSRRRTRQDTRPAPISHPLQALWAFRGPLRWIWDLPRAVQGRWVVPRYSHPGTHPVYPPWYPPGPRTPSPCTKLTVQYTVRDMQFWDTVGEPRGMGTHAGFRVPGWFIDLGLVCTAV